MKQKIRTEDLERCGCTFQHGATFDRRWTYAFDVAGRWIAYLDDDMKSWGLNPCLYPAGVDKPRFRVKATSKP